MVVTTVLVVLFGDALRPKSEPLKVPINKLQHTQGTQGTQACVFIMNNLHLVDFHSSQQANFDFWFFTSMSRRWFSQRPEILGSV